MKSREMPEIMKCLDDIFQIMPYPYKIKADNEFNKIEFKFAKKKF